MLEKDEQYVSFYYLPTNYLLVHYPRLYLDKIWN